MHGEAWIRSGREAGRAYILLSPCKLHPKEVESGTRVQLAENRNHSRYLRS